MDSNVITAYVHRLEGLWRRILFSFFWKTFQGVHEDATLVDFYLKSSLEIQSPRMLEVGRDLVFRFLHKLESTKSISILH